MKKIWALMAVGLGIVYCFVQNNRIQVEPIKVKRKDLPQELEGFKIVHLSDLHLPHNASNIENLIQLVKKQKPDLIVMTGDIIDRKAKIQTCGLSKLCRGLVKLCPVYGVTGNHEQTSRILVDFKKILIKSGVQLMDQTYKIMTVGSVKIAVMGLVDDESYNVDFLENPELKTSKYNILLVHRPLLWQKDLTRLQPDLVFNGHEHGGQVRIPFMGGLISHEQGFFPKYTSGLYVDKNQKSTVISRGLSSTLMLRINNRPHLPVITLTQEQKHDKKP